jgi:hypothetical protein
MKEECTMLEFLANIFSTIAGVFWFNGRKEKEKHSNK